MCSQTLDLDQDETHFQLLQKATKEHQLDKKEAEEVSGSSEEGKVEESHCYSEWGPDVEIQKAVQLDNAGKEEERGASEAHWGIEEENWTLKDEKRGSQGHWKRVGPLPTEERTHREEEDVGKIATWLQTPVDQIF